MASVISPDGIEMRIFFKPEVKISAIDLNQGAALIAGLGNPTAKYRSNRHNAGFMVVEQLAERLGVRFSRVESKSLVTRADYNGRRLILAKPQTFMNLSGQAVSQLARFYKVPIQDILIAYDDVDLPLGTLRLRPGGGAAGQKGMLSVIEQLGTQDIPRLRVGIGAPPGRMDAADYVLQDFSNAEKEIITITLKQAVDAILVFAIEGIVSAMNRFNSQGHDES